MTSAIQYFKLLNKNIELQLTFLNQQREFIELMNDEFEYKFESEEYNKIYDFYINRELDGYIIDMDDIHFLNNKIALLDNLKKDVQKKIMEFCHHEFVKDMIDIDENTSQQIEYCIHCETNYVDYCLYCLE